MKKFMMLLLAALLALAALTVFAQEGATDSPEWQNPFLTMQIKDLQGEDFDASVLEGKVLMLNFWASWCGPCIAEMPELDKLSGEYADRLALLGVMIDAAQMQQDGSITTVQQELDDARAYYEKAGIGYPSLIPNELMMYITYQASIQAIPTTIFFTPRGQALGVVQGARDYEGWKAIIEDIIAQSDAQAAETPAAAGEPDGGGE